MMSASPTTSTDLVTNLFLVEDLGEDPGAARLASRDRDALEAVADWITTFVTNPNVELRRAGPVCPFVPGALERKTLWLAPEQIDQRAVPDVVERIVDYKRLFLHAPPTDGNDAIYKAIVVVFTDLSADRAPEYFSEVEQDLKVSSYVDNGLVMGEFYAGNPGTAIYNQTFRPFTPPVPFLLMRSTVLSDWKFFLDDDDWLTRWAERFGASATLEVARELRRFPWRGAHE